MKVVMINDCAYVGETLIKYLPEDFKVLHLKRCRRFFDKTFGIAWKILRSEGDIYHVHYLLQDCYLALKFGKHPVVGHAHGTDLRRTVNHRIFGRIVRYNLEKCDVILVSTPDILEIAKKYNENAEYLPNPVDTSIFYPKPPVEDESGKLNVLIAGKLDWKVKGSHVAVEGLSKIKEYVKVYAIDYGRDVHKTMKLASSLGLHIHLLRKVSHSDVREYYWRANVIIDQFPKSGTLGMVTLEAIACGRPAIAYVSSKYAPYRDFPLKDLNTPEKVAEILLTEDLMDLWKQQYHYLVECHEPHKIAEKVRQIYMQLV